MNQITFSRKHNLAKKQIKNLYEDAGWENYTREKEKLRRAILQSQYVLTAWDQDKLVGLVRTVGDNETIVFIQDLLVLSSYQNQGIGERLLKSVLGHYQKADKILLLADEDSKLRAFYTKCGMTDIRDKDLMSFIRL